MRWSKPFCFSPCCPTVRIPARGHGAVEMTAPSSLQAKPTTLPRVPVNCCPSVRTLLLDYLHDERLAFEQHFRVSRSTFRRMASLFARRGSHSWARDLELLIFLHWLAMGTSYRAIASESAESLVAGRGVSFLGKAEAVLLARRG